MSYIVLGGGCFWGVEAYFSQVFGVTKTTAGYTGGKTNFPKYEDVLSGLSSHSEVIKVEFDGKKTNVKILVEHLFNIIDPCTINQQGDINLTKYKSGVYYSDDQHKIDIMNFIESKKKNYRKEILIEVKLLGEFWEAEEYHQSYVSKKI